MLFKIMSFLMAILLLLSTTSWRVEKHYCMGRLMDIALFADADTCGMDMPTSDADILEKVSSSCCDDTVVFVDGQDYLQFAYSDIDLVQQTFLTAFAYSFKDSIEIDFELLTPDLYHPPPILIKDIQLLDEVFLI